MTYWKYRESSLRFINIAYIIVYFVLVGLYKTTGDSHFFFNIYVNIAILSVLAIVLASSYVKAWTEKYQLRLNYILWTVTIISTVIAYYSRSDMYITSHLILLLISIYSLYSRSRMKNYILIYLILVLPFALISEVDFDRKLTSISAMIVVLTMAYVRGIYDEHIYNAYADTNQSQNMLLMNAQEAFALHRIVLDDSGNPVDYIYLAVNAAFEKITGLNGADIIGKTVLEVLPDTENYWIDIFGEVALERISRSVVNYSKAFGKYYEVRAYPTENLEFAVLFMDVTERLHNENKLKHAMKQSDNANQLKTQFLKDINHRLRTPLNGMMGMMQLIDISEVGQYNRELFEAMVLEMKHTRNIINQISKYIDIQGMDFEYTHNNVYNLVKDEVKNYYIDGLDIKVEQSEDKDLEIFIEKKVFLSVLRELVVNAKNHTSNNKVQIKLQYQHNRENQISYMRITVIDYGKGIEKDRLKYIFNEFYHHDFIHIYKESDSISIPMCKQMLLCCGGDLIVESVLNYGTSFTMILPVYNI
ncbi:MAG: hypothetical protein CVU98_04360 [Firmicutes bacterium HGW-Firmicutes-3]|nr:MAG: hypothetical protein CVU98_04360 [Firmicutes bacterium HGW-Firmicutes-3]